MIPRAHRIPTSDVGSSCQVKLSDLSLGSIPKSLLISIPLEFYPLVPVRDDTELLRALIYDLIHALGLSKLSALLEVSTQVSLNLVSGSLGSIHGAMQVITGFVRTEDQLLPVMRELLPVLMTILSANEVRP